MRNRKGNFMKKPWTIASTSEIVTEGSHRRCDGTHEHEEARGKYCKLAEDYTDDFARQVHVVLARAGARSEFAHDTSPHPPCAAAVLPSQCDWDRPRPLPPRYRPLHSCRGCSPACGGACAAATPSLALPTSSTQSVVTSQTLTMGEDPGNTSFLQSIGFRAKGPLRLSCQRVPRARVRWIC